MAVNIEVVHVRDPDSECTVLVFLNGEPADATVLDLDPGRGWTPEAWDALGDNLPQLTIAARCAYLEAWDELKDSKFTREGQDGV